jgi:hypothetical protein
MLHSFKRCTIMSLCCVFFAVFVSLGEKYDEEYEIGDFLRYLGQYVPPQKEEGFSVKTYQGKVRRVPCMNFLDVHSALPSLALLVKSASPSHVSMTCDPTVDCVLRDVREAFPQLHG